MSQLIATMWSPDLLRACGVSAALCFVLATNVFVAFDPVRVKLVEAPIEAIAGRVDIETEQFPRLRDLTPPFAVIARIRYDSPQEQQFQIQIDERVACSRVIRAAHARRIDCAWSAGWDGARAPEVVINGPRSPWALEYLEIASHHGGSGLDLVILPAASRRYTAPGVVRIVGAWLLVALILMLPPPERFVHPIRTMHTIAASLVAVLFVLVLMSRFVSPYGLMLSWESFLKGVGIVVAPRLWTAGRWLLRRPVDAPASFAPISHRSALWVLAVSGIVGFGIGMVNFPSWQVAVESAQVVAGLVAYPPGNPFYVYHTKVWTVLHQACALLLLAGVSEYSLSLIISGLLGMVSFQALSLVVYALSGDALLAIGSAFVIFLTGAAESGVIYPILLVGTTHTYGALGLSLIVLITAVLGAGWSRTGAFLLGVVPAVHPSVGGWFLLIVALAAASDFRAFFKEHKPAIPYFVAGFCLTAISLIVQLVFVYDAPPIDPELAARYLTAFVRFWDGHRGPVDLHSDGVALNVCALVLASIWLTVFNGDLPRSSRFLLRVVAVSAVLSLVLALVSRMRPEHLPAALVVLMPGRLLNFNAMIVPALVLGLIGRYGRAIWGAWLPLVVTAALLFSRRSRVWPWVEANRNNLASWLVPEAPTELLTVLTLASIALFAGARLAARENRGPGVRLARVAAIGVMAAAAIQTWGLVAEPHAYALSGTDDTALAVAGRARGLLVTSGSLQLVQLRTRRPVLLDGGGLDGLPYSIEAAPAMDRILRDVYGIDLFNPPEEARGLGAIPYHANQTMWQGYSPEKWQEVRRAYGVTQVLTYTDWTLALPIVVRDDAHVLYQIPP